MEAIILGLLFIGWLWIELSGKGISDRKTSGHWYSHWLKRMGIEEPNDQDNLELTEEDLSPMTTLIMYDDFMEDGDLDLF